MRILDRRRQRDTGLLVCVTAFALVLLGNVQHGLAKESYSPATEVAPSAELIELGKAAFEEQCVVCHGPEGQGQGPAAYLLFPKPRNFVTARYRIVSTWDGVPTDEDLYRTISRGMPGSAMPSWGHLPEETRWGLVHYVKSFAKRPWTIEPPLEPTEDGDMGEGVIRLPPEPAYTADTRKRAAKLFLEQGCAGCHGTTGRGDGVKEQIDDDGYPTQPRDLTLGIYKGSPDAESVYRRITAGMPGTPMPMSDWAHGSDAWNLTRYVLAMSSEGARARYEMPKLDIVATRISELPRHADARVWRQAPPSSVHLMPLWWEDGSVGEISVRALHDGEEIALLLVWHDDTHDRSTVRPQDFRDAVAIEFSLASDPPFFGMGESAKLVNIWMWKSEMQADLASGYQDIEDVYPDMVVDTYPSIVRSSVDQPMGDARTVGLDPTYIAGWGAGNPVSDPRRPEPVEVLQAHGHGTLQARPPIDQTVEANGLYRADTYRVVFRRVLTPKGKKDTGIVRLQPGTEVAVAFAVWNGNARDRDGKKNISIWQSIEIAP